MNANIRYRGSVYDCWDSETVLNSLLRHGVAFNFSCRKGVCLECMMRTTAGAAPEAAAPGDLVEKGKVLDGFYVPTRYPNGHPEGAPWEHYGMIQSDEGIRYARETLEFVRAKMA